MSFQVNIRKESNHIAQINIFGKSFEFIISKSPKIKKVDAKIIAPILARNISEVRYEWGRSDNKKVILFYERSDLYGHIRYKFSVEEDDALSELMKTQYENPNHINQMISYMCENHDKLNFI